MATTTIVLVDEHRTFLDLLAFAIDRESDLAVVGMAGSAQEGQRVVARTRPDIVVLESLLPDGDGVAMARTLLERQPGLRVVVLTAAEDAGLVARVAASGAAGFLAKAGALKKVIETIRTARCGSMIVDPLFLEKMQVALSRADEDLCPALTHREFDVLSRLDQGKDPRTISRELSISLHTCRGYVKSLLLKLDSHTQLEAVITARRRGLVPEAVPLRPAG